MTPPFSPSSSLASTILFADIKKNGTLNDQYDSGIKGTKVIKCSRMNIVSPPHIKEYPLRHSALLLKKRDVDPENWLA